MGSWEIDAMVTGFGGALGGEFSILWADCLGSSPKYPSEKSCLTMSFAPHGDLMLWKHSALVFEMAIFKGDQGQRPLCPLKISRDRYVVGCGGEEWKEEGAPLSTSDKTGSGVNRESHRIFLRGMSMFSRLKSRKVSGLLLTMRDFLIKFSWFCFS